MKAILINILVFVIAAPSVTISQTKWEITEDYSIEFEGRGARF
ncbi:hypothetical protein [Reichenbachiella ulvae]|uniref:Uncharacterized protein n=1 Tax=Reichenbachiella ulvae TaxID=2980104 RepID=A0ABT3CR79_9BACT|nr:hypothetical protein [Reichenbachiella ulvae]MCV9386078.1 hypothetical protein [Reichenbachiella ulvae]